MGKAYTSMASGVAPPTGTLKSSNSQQVWQAKRDQKLHIEKLSKVKGVLGKQQATEYTHIKVNAKRELMRKEQEGERNRDNAILLKKLYDTVGRQSDASKEALTQDAREKALLEAAAARRRAQQREIDEQNQLLVKKIQNYESEYATRKLEKDWKFLESSRVQGGQLNKKTVLSLPVPAHKKSHGEEGHARGSPSGFEQTLHSPSKAGKPRSSAARVNDLVPAALRQVLSAMENEGAAALQHKVESGVELNDADKAQLCLSAARIKEAEGHELDEAEKAVLEEAAAVEKARAGYLLSAEELASLSATGLLVEQVDLAAFWSRACESPEVQSMLKPKVQEGVLLLCTSKGLGPYGLIECYDELVDETLAQLVDEVNK
mmetsp:Transcript_23758/g.51948  ORF Transcript_23758/g.51948 Transcript_23758/m.51948 type:complete len:376 (-) Transcript_23758:549-1676(-)